MVEYAPLTEVIFFQEGPGIRNWQYVNDDDGVRFINIRCIQNHELQLASANRISASEAYGKYKHFLVESGDILMSTSGTLGRYAIARDDHLPLCMNTSVIRFRPLIDEKTYAFVYGYLTSNEFYSHLQGMANGSAQVNFGPTHLRQINIPLPSADRICQFDAETRPIIDSMNKLRSENKTLSELRDELLPKLLSGEIDVSQVDLTQLNNHLYEFMAILIELKERTFMNTQTKDRILLRMQPVLTGVQLKLLKEALTEALPEQERDKNSINYLNGFLQAKEVEGCSPKTLAYYQATIEHMNMMIGKEPTVITTDDLRSYLRDYETTRNSSKITIDNIRRILSSYFSWLEDEDYIVKSPVRRIRHVRAPKPIKETFTDEQLELVRNSCEKKRDLAIVDLLTSTGMRIGELVRLNISDINFIERECIVTGKGNKQRHVYFDARTKLHLQQYLETRRDSSQALFVSLNSPASRIGIGAVELRLRRIGRKAEVARVHPHKFRRTLATQAIEKGMPIEQVQKLLGHAKIDTTMHYAMVNQSNVKASHRRYLE